MMKRLLTILCIPALLLCALAACASPAKVFTADEGGVSYKVKTGRLTNNMDDAQEKAAIHCAQYGKKSEFEGIQHTGIYKGITYGRIAIFRCR